MSPLFSKLNLKTQRAIWVLEAPASFEPELQALYHVTVHRELSADDQPAFVLAFAMTQTQLDRISATLVGATEGDATLWIAYPKGSSRRYRCEFNRDSGWDVLEKAGFQKVRQVSIDEDWSALRFRRVAHIGTPPRRPA